MNSSAISKFSKWLLFLGAAALIVTLFVPLWRIDLDAPQYPEGLVLKIYPHKLGGDVEIINGLNHYIGMQTLHTESFIEFTVLPYIIGVFSFLLLLTILVNRKKGLYFLFGAFVLFGIIAMYDFWRWEYNYGHNLDPNAAIIVPGMAYQPPLIGFKQLLNFGAYSIPDTGGWLFILCGLLLLTAVLIETGWLNRWKKRKPAPAATLLALSLLASCSGPEPEQIILNKDHCDYCRMSISDGRLATEMMTEKGRVYKFDDILCMASYTGEHKEVKAAAYWVGDYTEENELIPAGTAFYVVADEIRSPMGGNTAAFSDRAAAWEIAVKYNTEVLDWNVVGIGK